MSTFLGLRATPAITSIKLFRRLRTRAARPISLSRRATDRRTGVRGRVFSGILATFLFTGDFKLNGGIDRHRKAGSEAGDRGVFANFTSARRAHRGAARKGRVFSPATTASTGAGTAAS